MSFYCSTDKLETAELEVDAIIAQGTEAGGFCSNVSTLSLIPPMVDDVFTKPST